jgi:signal transduction histidine kinase
MSDARLPARVENVLYRIVQEALNNVSKHAHASSVKIGAARRRRHQVRHHRRRARLRRVSGGGRG